jgi:hypothetical protein
MLPSIERKSGGVQNKGQLEVNFCQDRIQSSYLELSFLSFFPTQLCIVWQTTDYKSRTEFVGLEGFVTYDELFWLSIRRVHSSSPEGMGNVPAKISRVVDGV